MRFLGRSGDDRSDVVVAEFAAVLDGRRLWLAVAAEHGPIVLRDPATGTKLTLTSETDDAAYCSVRHDLTTLPAGGEATYDVLCAAGQVAAPDVADGPTRTPTVGPDSFALMTSGDGTLQVLRTSGEHEARVTGISVGPDDSVLLRVASPEEAPGPERIELVQKHTTLAELPVVDGVATLPPGLAVDLPDGGCRLVAASGTTTWPLRRQRNDLVRPQAAVQLPTWGPGGRFELVWAASGDLRARPTGGGA